MDQSVQERTTSLQEAYKITYNSHNGIKLAPIGSKKGGALSEQAELVSTHAKCMNTNLMEVLSIFMCPAEIKDKVSGR